MKIGLIVWLPIALIQITLFLYSYCDLEKALSLAMKHGAGFVRSVFLFVVSALILKTGWDAFLR